VLIIIVAITGLSGYAIPNYPMSFGVRIFRFIFIFLGAIAGFYGISAGIFIFGGYICSMKSFGVPYLAPIAPTTKSNPDIVNKGPVWMQNDRPDFLNTQNRKHAVGKMRNWIDQ
jgi:spore germination protein KA